MPRRSITKKWNPFFVSYAKAHGRSPEDQVLHNTEEYPGGSMTGFILWINEQMYAFELEVLKRKRGNSLGEGLSDEQSTAFGEFLARCANAFVTERTSEVS